ncbi:unnamed protein product [Merluccius merluccius]
MEEVYRRFNSYDFEADDRFRSGSLVLDGSAQSGLDVKLFYYNRCVEPIDPAGYRRWGGGDPAKVGPRPQEEQMRSPPGPGLSRGDLDGTETQVLSFQEVVRLVQAGEQVPGLGTHVDITPSNQNPTPSTMERVLKPWETR